MEKCLSIWLVCNIFNYYRNRLLSFMWHFNNHTVKLYLLLSLERTLEQANYLGAMVMSINKSMGNCWGQTLRYVLITVVSATPDIYSISPFQRAHSTFWSLSWLIGGRDFLTVGCWISLVKDLYMVSCWKKITQVLWGKSLQEQLIL